MSAAIARGADTVVEELLQEAPAHLILGPRATGKTTTAARFARSLVRLDREADAAAFRAEASYTSKCGHLYHLRTEQGRQEIDLVAEFGGGKIVWIEVQATSAPNAKDAAHLAWLRDQLGAHFMRGVVLHTGPRSFELGERIAAAPISAMWGPG